MKKIAMTKSKNNDIDRNTLIDLRIEASCKVARQRKLINVGMFLSFPEFQSLA